MKKKTVTKYGFLEKKPILKPRAEGHLRFETELAKENNFISCKKNIIFQPVFLETIDYFISSMCNIQLYYSTIIITQIQL